MSTTTIRTLEARVRRIRVLTVKHIDKGQYEDAQLLMVREDRALWSLAYARAALVIGRA